jgi:YD repeat-containing protein
MYVVKRGAGLLLATSAAAIAVAAQAETTNYTYDALGRLVAETIDNGRTTQLGYDPAGNRSSYAVTGAGTPPPPSPPPPSPPPPPPPAPPPPPSPPPPPPPPPNQPPVTGADSLSLLCYSSGTVNLTANDSDPENNLPLTLVSIAYAGGEASPPAAATIISASSVQVDAGFKGQSTFTYTVRDSLNASSTGQLTVTATGSLAFCQGGG